MHLARFPRRRYTQGWTPLEKLDRLSALLGGPDIYIKRDDLLGLAGGGNKTRKLEFLVADALAKGADTLITCGAVQSNHCRLTLAAAVKEGLKCRLVLEERVANSYSPDATRQQLPVPAARRRGGDGRADRRGPRRRDAEGGRRGRRARPQGVHHPRRRVEPARRARLRVVRRGDPRPDARARHPPRPHRLRQRQHRHARRAHLRPGRQQQPHPAHRDQRPADARRSRSRTSTSWRRRRPRCSASPAGSRARRSPRSATGSAPATRCRRRRWSRRCGCWRGWRASCSTRSTPARRWRA